MLTTATDGGLPRNNLTAEQLVCSRPPRPGDNGEDGTPVGMPGVHAWEQHRQYRIDQRNRPRAGRRPRLAPDEIEDYYNASGVEQREWEYRRELVRSADDASLGSRSSLSGDNDGGNPNQQSEPEQEPEPTRRRNGPHTSPIHKLLWQTVWGEYV